MLGFCPGLWQGKIVIIQNADQNNFRIDYDTIQSYHNPLSGVRSWEHNHDPEPGLITPRGGKLRKQKMHHGEEVGNKII